MAESNLFYGLSKNIVVLVLSFIGGFVDAVGYIELFGLFTSSITGNLVGATAALFKHDGDIFARVFVTLFFAAGAFITNFIALTMKSMFKASAWTVAMASLAQEIVTLFVVVAVGMTFKYSKHGIPTISSYQCLLVGSIMGVSMGMQSSAALVIFNSCPSTTVMTTNITKASMAAAGVAHTYAIKDEDGSEERKREEEAEVRAKFIEFALVIALFVIGATAGSALVMVISFWSLSVPIGLLIGMMVSLYMGKIGLGKEETARTEGSALPVR